MAEKILLVEDEAVLALSESKTLEKHGYMVRTAYTGESAIDIIKSDGEISLVLMDIDLGEGIDGTETAKRILRYRNVPIVFLSSHSEKEYVNRVKEITGYGYVLKNSGEFVLIESIKMAFQLFNAHRITRESEEKYKAAFMTSPDSVNINRLDGLYVDINEGFTALTGFTRQDVIGKLSSEINIWAIPEDRGKLVQGLKKDGYVENLESVFRCKDGTLKTALMSARLIQINNEPHILSITRDITKRKEIEEKLKNNEERFRLAAGKAERFLDNISDIAYETDVNGTVTYVNAAAEHITGFSLQDIIGKPFLPLFKEKDYHSLMAFYKRSLQGERLENTWTFMNGAVCHFTSLPRYNSEGKIIGTFGIARDVTEQKKIEEKLKLNIKRYEKAQQLGRVGNWEYNLQTDAYWGSDQAKRMYGLNPETDHFNAELVESLLPEKEKVQQALIDLIKKGKEYNLEFDLITYDTRKRKTMASVAELEKDSFGKPLKVSGVVQDITERKTAEKKLAEALEQKDFLMQELNHRVKNNLLMISSLISLKETASKNLEGFSDIKKQIDAIRIIHEKLYEKKDVTRVAVQDYLPDLLETIFSSFTIQNVEIKKDIDNISLPTKTAVAVGLIINEIATNAIKYGFSQEKKAVFSIAMKMNTGCTEYFLTLSNTGNPFPENIDLYNSESLGLRLISALVGQLAGTIELQKNPFPIFKIKFPVE